MITNCQLLLQSINEAIYMLDEDGYIQYANPASTPITGYTADELLNKHLSLFYPTKEDIVKAEYELSQALKNGSFLAEGWRIRRDGSQYWGEMLLSPIADEKGVRTGYSCILRDISEKKNRDLELRQSEERYRLMVEGVKDYAIFMMDSTGHIMTWNQGAQKIKGYSPNEIIGKHFSTFYTSEDLEDKKPERELRIAVATGKYEEEGWRVKKNGMVFWANIVITALYNEQNEFIGFSKVTRDLTERKHNEEELRQSEERYRSLVEQVTDYGIFMMDERGRIVSWNEGARRINGYTVDEIVGKYFSIFYPKEDIIMGKPAYELKTALEKGKYEEEGWRLRKDGSRYWASIIITPVYNNDGSLIGYSKVAKDLTERKASERALKESYQRYRQLASELKVANSELSYANQELEQFTSIVSHDLQEPIRTIKSFLKLIQIKISEEQYAELDTYINKSINAASRMKELIQNLLQYAQLGKKEVVMETVDVQELLNEAVQNVKSAMDASGAEVAIQSDVKTIKGDRVQLLQVVQNLLSNALKFTDNQVPRVTIRVREENGYPRFEVSDNGIGIAKTDLAKVFDIFRRLHTRKDYPGTGIGLAICKKIVDRHSGRIWPESEPGKGTTFYFTLNETQELQPHEEI